MAAQQHPKRRLPAAVRQLRQQRQQQEQRQRLAVVQRTVPVAAPAATVAFSEQQMSWRWVPGQTQQQQLLMLLLLLLLLLLLVWIYAI
jgi:hypothetical protein